jgi:hypothetical protein
MFLEAVVLGNGLQGGGYNGLQSWISALMNKHSG